MDALCKHFRDRYDIAAITNDIYTKEDAEFLTRAGSLPVERIMGIETGGCPHTAIREDASINLAGVADLRKRFPRLDLILIESGGDNLAATFSPELADLTIYVIDVSAGDKIPRKGGPGITRSDLLVINKIDLAPYVGASLDVMDRDARKMRGDRPFVFANVRAGKGVAEIAAFIEKRGGFWRLDRPGAGSPMAARSSTAVGEHALAKARLLSDTDPHIGRRTNMADDRRAQGKAMRRKLMGDAYADKLDNGVVQASDHGEIRRVHPGSGVRHAVDAAWAGSENPSADLRYFRCGARDAMRN